MPSNGELSKNNSPPEVVKAHANGRSIPQHLEELFNNQV
jgi:hypothetical protein